VKRLKITIKSGPLYWQATVFATPTGKLIYQSLPLKGKASRWGQEIYFAVPVAADLETDALELVAKGDLGYWPGGRAFCIFFGPTPISGGNEIRPAGAVNVFGRIEGDLSDLNKVKDGDEVTVEKSWPNL